MSDLINRQDAIEALVNKGQASTRYKIGDFWELNGQEIREVLNAMPSVADVVEVKHGRWIDTGSGQECSICQEIQYGYDSARNFCPNCGADMRGDMYGNTN